jgi:hypothetical protein
VHHQTDLVFLFHLYIASSAKHLEITMLFHISFLGLVKIHSNLNTNRRPDDESHSLDHSHSAPRKSDRAAKEIRSLHASYHLERRTFS